MRVGLAGLIVVSGVDSGDIQEESEMEKRVERELHARQGYEQPATTSRGTRKKAKDKNREIQKREERKEDDRKNKNIPVVLFSTPLPLPWPPSLYPHSSSPTP